MNTKWTTKEEYLQFVKDWKQTYADLSKLIRTARFLARAGSSFNSGVNRYKVTKEQLDEANKQFAELRTKVREATGTTVWNASAFATDLLAVRRDEKVRAGLARQADLDARKEASSMAA